jgi:hypothetical protein
MVIAGWLKNWRLRRERLRSRRPRLAADWRHAYWAAECLEARALLSNIAVTTTGGVITLTGDSGDHTFDASVVGSNFELAGSGGTTFTFNSTTSATVDIPLSSLATIKGLTMTMQGGNDSITFNATGLATISGNVLVNLGGGTNSLKFTDATVTGKMTVIGGSGADSVQLSGDTLGALSIWTGDGGDTINLSTITINPDQTDPDSDMDFGWWGAWWGGFWGRLEHRLEGADGSLNIQTGSGNDAITLNSVTGTSSSGGSLWHLFDGLWCVGSQWRISTGSGTDSVSFDSVTTPRSLSVQGGSGNDTVNLTNTTVSGLTNVALSAGEDQIHVSGSTFTGPTRLATGAGDGQTISVDDSTFKSFTSLSVPGSGAQLKVETNDVADPGTTFQRAVVVSLPGPSAVADFAAAGANNTLDFQGFVFVFGGNPEATVNIATANTTIDDNKLFLFSADRNNV